MDRATRSLAALVVASLLFFAPAPSQAASKDWCAILTSWLKGGYQQYSGQYVKGMCAHQQFESRNYGGRIKYTNGTTSVIPDGRSYSGDWLYELKPNGAAARKAAERTAKVSGLRVKAFYWVHNGGTSFTFRETGTSVSGIAPRSKYTTPVRIAKYGKPPILGGGAGSPWNVNELPGLEDDAPPYTYAEEVPWDAGLSVEEIELLEEATFVEIELLPTDTSIPPYTCYGSCLPVEGPVVM